MGCSILLTLGIVFGHSLTASGLPYTQEEYNLRQTLVGPGSSYSSVVRPATQVDVQMRFNLLSINDLSTRGQTISVAGWLTVKWTDPRLTWTPASAGNIEYMFDTELVLWRPSIMVDNSVTSVGIIEHDSLLLRVKYTGEITWEPPGLYTTSCDIDVTYYPFERQTCTVEVTSWGYTTSEVNLTHLLDKIFTEDYSTNGEWVLMSTEISTKYLVESEGTFSQLDFTVKLQRRVTYYVLNIVLPIVLTSFLSIFTFILPFESGEKVSYALTVLLAYAVFMLLVSDNVPQTSIHVSVLGLYLALILFVGVLSTILAVVNLKIFHTDPNTPVSKTSQTFVSTILVPLSGWRKVDDGGKAVRSSKVKITPMDNSDPEEQEKEQPFYSWKEIALMSDVLCFRVFTVFVSLLAMVFLVVLAAGGATS